MRESEKKVLAEMTAEVEQSIKQLSTLQGDIFGMLCKGTRDFVGVLVKYAEENILGEEELKNEYCKIYDFIEVALSTGSISEELIEAITCVSRQVDEIKPKKLEVVFFCYKASMSDSLESIFWAAHNDPDCDAYFVPIPYYDLGPDLKPIKEHLDSTDCYPDGFPLTDYRLYNTEKRHPDVIFIMNPYDECNRATRVHEGYYSRTLRNYTKHLVYVEYGLPVWMANNPADPKLEPSFLPVHVWCHHYIGVTKEMSGYLRHFLKPGARFSSGLQIPYDDPDEKYLDLGSPKFDKIKNTSKSDYSIPEEWKKVIGNKKVILYNTGVSELLKSSSAEDPENKGKAYFGKLSEILNAFSEHEEVVLWWRPHPLFETTLRALHPGLVETYKELVNEFLATPNGIFDTSVELTRAIKYCDGMISDESSLLWLAIAEAKPFYIPAIYYARKNPGYDDGADFSTPLMSKLSKMRAAKGANVRNVNAIIWWHNFLDEDLLGNVKYVNFPARFIDFITHPEKYSEYDEYRALLLQMYRDFVINPDGTAGQKIYECLKEKALGDRNGQNT